MAHHKLTSCTNEIAPTWITPLTPCHVEKLHSGTLLAMLKADTCTLRRWCGGVSSKESLRPRPGSSKIRLECYGDGCGILDAKSEKTGPQVATERSGFHNDCHFSHKVREGDTLTWIANKYQVTVQSIALSNEIADVDYIPAGKSLLIPIEYLKSGEGHANADGSSSLAESQGSQSQRVVVHTKSSLSSVPVFASSGSFQSWHVRLALFLVLLFALSTFLKRCISDLRTRRHKEVLRYQVEKEVQDAHHQPKLRRWQGILDDDLRIDEVDGDSLADGRTVLDAEEEKLHQSYAQLESVYVKFLADSGLSKSGYWRGGLPPALEEK